jgi:hypothetical protein
MTRFLLMSVAGCWRGAPSLTNGRVYSLQLLLYHASAGTLWFKSRGTHYHIFCLTFETPQLGGPGPSIYIPQEQDGPVISLGIGFRFRSLLLFAGLDWRYSNLLHMGINQSQSYITADGQSDSLSWCQAPIWDLRPIFVFFFYLSLGNCGFVDVARPLWREDWSVVYSFCWASPEYIASPTSTRERRQSKKLSYYRRSVSQYVLVSGHHLGTVTNFSFIFSWSYL